MNLEFYIDSTFEFFEVINEFPCLKSTLNSLHLPFKDIREGESIHSFFLRKNINFNEEKILLRKLNRDVNYFLKKGKLPKIKKIQMFSLEEE